MEKITRNNKSDWKIKSFPECIKSVRFERSKQIKTNFYLPSGDFPIIDQGQSKIAGWTNDKSRVINDNLPLIIFGDHTRVFKFIDFPFAIGADGTKLIKPHDDKFCSRYFYYYLRSLNLPSKGYSRHFKLLKETEIFYPEIPEQEKIAAVLFKIQQAIEVQESIIEATQELKKSTMQHVFTYGLRGEKTKEAEIGKIPESWSVVAVKEVYEFVKKPRHISYSDYDNIPFLPMDLIPNNTPHLTDYSLKKSSEINSGTYFEAGNLLISKITPCFENGKQCIASNLPNGFGIATTEVIPIRERDNISNKYYLFYYLLKNDVRSGIACKMEGATGRQRVPVHLLKDLSIPLPSLPEQDDIAKIFLTIDRNIEHHICKKIVLRDLFKTMLNKLMSGEIRVKDSDIDTSCVLEMKSRG